MLSNDIKILGTFLMREESFGHFLTACFFAISLTRDVSEKQSLFRATLQ